MPFKVIILTNCTERKRGRARAIHLRDVTDSLPTKARRWCRHLVLRDLPKYTALNLYQGGH